MRAADKALPLKALEMIASDTSVTAPVQDIALTAAATVI